tara:strand:+ start:60 stop:569 length:510 start_codon:yes stop_codon:yes gene_type:complete
MIALDMPIKFFIFLIIFLFHAASTYSEENSQLIEIENPRFTEKGLDDKIYEIKAEKGLQSEDYLELTKVEGKFKTDGNKWIFLEADKGIFSQSTNIIQLKDNIIFFTKSDESFKSDIATFDMKNDIVNLTKIQHKRKNNLIIADQSVIKDNFSKIIYEGNVIAKINFKN